MVFLQRTVIRTNCLTGKSLTANLFATNVTTGFALTLGTYGLEQQKKTPRTW
jgi:hypothetical protein